MRELTLLVAMTLTPVFAESPRLAVDSATVAGGQWILQVRNASEVPATAFAVGTSEANYATTDVLLGARGGHPVWPGETVEVRLPKAGADQPAILAAVFEDGTTAGDARWVNHLLTTLQSVYHDLPNAISLLRHAAERGERATTVAGWFHQWSERYRASHPADGNPVALAAEMLFAREGNQPAAQPARDLTQLFEGLFSSLAESKPAL